MGQVSIMAIIELLRFLNAFSIHVRLCPFEKWLASFQAAWGAKRKALRA
jgi:hypothetical protein